MFGVRAFRNAAMKVCRTAAGYVLGCCCPPGACASGPALLKSCTGKNLVRRKFTVSGTANGSIVANENVSIDGTGYHVEMSAEWTAAFSLTVIAQAGAATFEGRSGDFPDDTSKNFDTISPLASITLSASGSAAFTVGGPPVSGSLSRSGQRTWASLEASMSIDGAGHATAAVKVMALFRFQGPEVTPGVPTDFSMLGVFDVLLEGDAEDLAAVCATLATVTADEQTSLDASGTFGGFGGNVIEVTDTTSDWDGTATATLQNLAAPDDEEDDPLGAMGCSRFLTVAAQTPENDSDPPYSVNTTGRLWMPTVASCGEYYPSWVGTGVATRSDTSHMGGQPQAVALSASVSGGVGESGDVMGEFGATVTGAWLTVNTAYAPSQATWAAARGYSMPLSAPHLAEYTADTNGTFRLFSNTDSTAALSYTSPSASAIQAAMETLTEFATGIVRVYEFTDYPYPSGSTRAFIITYAGNTSGVLSRSGFAVTLAAGLGPAGANSNGTAFTADDRCLENATITPITRAAALGDFNPNPADGYTLAFTATDRIDGDPTYICDCPEGEDAPSSMAVVLASPAVGANAAVAASFNIPKLSSTPLFYYVIFSPTSGPGTGDNFTATIERVGGAYVMKIFDDEGSQIAKFRATCGVGKSLPNMDWKLVEVTGLYAPYTALTVTTS